jgi:hypothetical protein
LLGQTPIHRLMVGGNVTSEGKDVHFGLVTWSQPDWFWAYFQEEVTKGVSGLAARFNLWFCPPVAVEEEAEGADPQATEAAPVTVPSLEVRTFLGSHKGLPLTFLCPFRGHASSVVRRSDR